MSCSEEFPPAAGAEHQGASGLSFSAPTCAYTTEAQYIDTWDRGDPFATVAYQAVLKTSITHRAQEQVQWMRKHDIRHGKATGRSILLSDRVSQDRFEHHVPLDAMHGPGDRIALLFGFILSHITVAKFLSRTGLPTPPKAAVSVRKFHSEHSKQFKLANPFWDEYPEAEMAARLREFLFRLFSTDRERKMMTPSNGQRPRLCDASWGDFWLDEQELNAIVESTVMFYLVHRSAV